jgi:hypothetical protein
MEIGELHGVLQLCLSGDVAQRKAGEDRLKQVTMFSVAAISSMFCSETGVVYEERHFFLGYIRWLNICIWARVFYIYQLFWAVQGFESN